MSILTRYGGALLAPPPLWSPSQLPTAIWLDASDASSIILNGSSVSQWNDRSRNGRNVTQSTASQQPIYSQNSLNGRPVLTFDGSNDILSNPSVGASGLTSVTIISVFKLNSGGSSEDLPMGTGSAPPSAGGIRAFYRSPNGSTVGFAGWSNDVTSSAYGYDIGGSFHIFEVFNTGLGNSNTAIIGRDGVTSSYSPSGSGFASTIDGFFVGSLQGTSNYYTSMSVAEIIVLYSAISLSNRQKVEGYLAHKWGLAALLSSEHPFKLRPPRINE